ncbi:Integrase catalytic domain-containing protein [Aphis craccivora]|uniref:Integrase catalytic domain-containing protein n=1 Tax=Aphis craccivora TaxID=307492 RepID=A0A6G0YX56_APHCR|nr:Integrase catalytic domain-containing protein [Aphis craccivora]
MSDYAVEQLPIQHNAQARAYQGPPHKQRNPKAQNTWKAKPNQDKGQKQGFRRADSRTAPPTLPPPTMLHDTSHVKLTEVNPAEGSLFNPGVAIREVEPRTTFTPSVPALIDISRATYMEMVTSDPNIAKVMLPEYLDYYSTALLWLRIVSLKKKN